MKRRKRFEKMKKKEIRKNYDFCKQMLCYIGFNLNNFILF